RCRGLLQGVRGGDDDSWWLRLRQGISCRALSARSDDPAHRADQPATDLVLHRGARPRPAEILLTPRFPIGDVVCNLFASFRRVQHPAHLKLIQKSEVSLSVNNWPFESHLHDGPDRCADEGGNIIILAG